MFKKKEKPSKIKIELSFDKCKESIQELLDNYNAKIEGYLSKIVNLKREKRLLEADRYKEKLKLVIVRQTKMMDLMDQVEQFEFMIDEAFAKNAVYGTLASTLSETNKLKLTPEIKSIVSNMNKFEKTFKKGVTKFDAIFGKISSSITQIDNSMEQDAEINDIVNSRLKEYDEQTTNQAGVDIDSLFDIE